TAAAAEPMFREPTLHLPEMRARDPGPPHELPVVQIEADSLNARRLEAGESRVDPPTLSLPVMDARPAVPRGRGMEPTLVEPTMAGVDSVKLARSDEFAGSGGDFDVPRLDTPAPKRVVAKGGSVKAGPATSEEQAFNDAVFGGPASVATRGTASAVAVTSIGDAAPSAKESATGESGAADSIATLASPATPTAPVFTAVDAAAVSEPIVDWPPESERRVVALRLVAPPPERLAGRALRLALAAEGFVLGKFQIFHKPDNSGRAALSAASLSKPGTFDIETMDLQRYGGLSLFAVLPGPKPPLKAFDDLLATARNLNERLQGALQDEHGGPLTPTRIATVRETLGAETPP
ncbi:MAG: cell division protein ZipA C-terminal FtsZ-binding domain-containing protein, partial [Steroidobacteraceae bacterium]